MNRLTSCVLVAVGVAVGPLRSATPAPDVTSLLAKVTTETASVRIQVLKDLVAMGDDGIVAVAKELVEPKAGEVAKDAGARMALHGMAVYVTRPGAEKERAAYVKKTLSLLDSDRPAAIKKFLVEQLQIAGRDEAVLGLAGCLKDKELAESARQALEANPTDAAVVALRHALAKAQGTLRVGIINSLGRRCDKESVKALVAEAKSSDEAVRCAALVALGRIGDPAARPVIEAALNSDSKAEKRSATEANLLLSKASVKR